MASLSVSAISSRYGRTNANEQIDYPLVHVPETPLTLIPDGKVTSAEAWERFESDYSPPRKSSLSIKREIASAKYGLDTAVFAVDRFLKSVESQADFSFDQGSLRRTREIPFEETLLHPRVKLDLNLGDSARPYIGVRVVIPFGK